MLYTTTYRIYVQHVFFLLTILVPELKSRQDVRKTPTRHLLMRRSNNVFFHHLGAMSNVVRTSQFDLQCHSEFESGATFIVLGRVHPLRKRLKHTFCALNLKPRLYTKIQLFIPFVHPEYCAFISGERALRNILSYFFQPTSYFTNALF